MDVHNMELDMDRTLYGYSDDTIETASQRAEAAEDNLHRLMETSTLYISGVSTDSVEQPSDIAANVGEEPPSPPDYWTVVANAQSFTVSLSDATQVDLWEHILQERYQLQNVSNKHGQMYKVHQLMNGKEAMVTVTLYKSTARLHVQGKQSGYFMAKDFPRLGRDAEKRKQKLNPMPTLTSTPVSAQIKARELMTGADTDLTTAEENTVPDNMGDQGLPQEVTTEEKPEQTVTDTCTSSVQTAPTQDNSQQTVTTETEPEETDSPVLAECPGCETFKEGLQELTEQHRVEMAALRRENFLLHFELEPPQPESTSVETQTANLECHCDTEQTTPEKQKQNQASKKLLIGASILRDINPKGLKNTDVVSIGGATNQRLEDKLKAMDLQKYEVIIVQCSTNDKSQPKVYRDGVSSLVKTVKDKASDARLILATVCPRGDRLQHKVPGFNDAILEVSEEENIQLVQSQDAFQHGDGSLNHSLYENDCLHLSRKGTSVLLKTIHKQVPILLARVATKKPSQNESGWVGQHQHGDSDRARQQRESDRQHKQRNSDKPRQQWDSDRPRQQWDSGRPRQQWDSGRPRQQQQATPTARQRQATSTVGQRQATSTVGQWQATPTT